MAAGVPNILLDIENEILYKFLENSTLKIYLSQKTGVTKDEFTFSEILINLVNTIKQEQLFDEQNPSIVICSPELEEALDMRAFHVTELRDLVILQLESAEGLSFNQIPRNVSSEVTSVKRFSGHPSFPFKLQPNFLKVIRSVEGSDPNQIIFRYEDIVEHFSKYILSNRNEIFDPRNLKVALVENGPLGVAFRVSAFHRCQARQLLDQQLVCLNLKHLSAWRIVRWMPSYENICCLDIPRELKDLLVKMATN